MKKQTSIVIGMGEVGEAIATVFSSDDNPVPARHDPAKGYEAENRHYDYMHICFPYTPDFTVRVQVYQSLYTPDYTIIHSTVPVGTSRQVNALHSPIRGIHPNLVKGILAFPKFIGGVAGSEVADYFRRAGMKVILVDQQEATEAGKLFDTEYYRACIEFCQRVKHFCLANDLNFHEVYTLFNQTYNEGYTELGHPEFVRPVLQPILTEIGGHCVLPNAKLIKEKENNANL